MRSIAGILCFFLLFYMLTFVRLTSAADGIVLIAPGTTSFNEWNMYSPYWLAFPIIIGAYFLITGEIEYFMKKLRDKSKK